MTKVAVIGAGSWGTTFAKVLADGGSDVALWSRRSELAGEMLGKGYSKKEVLARLSQTAEGLASVSTILELARAKGISMPIVEQVELVIEGKMSPKDIAPHLTHETEEPQGE